ncbi:MAG TPA: efflux RND transporter permease subunit [Bryobacteraceae bacterium]|nr:efflux RND transporter permease subunit [Bryobacteraceae bacterium]
MNIGEFSVRRNRVILASIVIVLIGGIVAYQRLGRLEDPEFTIKEALIVTPYPGASPEEVALEVTNPIESACQQLAQLKRVESESTRGRSVVSAIIQDRYDKDKIPQVWDELRRKINDIQFRLPPAARGNSVVIDDFGDVYGIFLAITGDGYSQPELRRYAEFLRRELLQVRDVKKIELFGEQQEQAFLEISRQRLANLGINEDQIYSQLQARSMASDGGRVRIGDEHVAIESTGGFGSVEDMLGLVIGSDRSGRQLFLRNIATVERGNQDPPERLLRFDGRPAIGIGISTVPGGNVVKMGQAVQTKLEELKRNQPVGIDIGEINFQPQAVVKATGAFMFNLGKAVTIVFIVLLFAMGRKAGFMIGFVLFLTIMGTFLVMYVNGSLLMERISLGALIIALCMLTDNAIVITESLKVRIEGGEDKLHVIRETIAQNQWPLFGATGIAVVAFAAIGLSEDRTGEYCNSLFWVIFISLALSWVAAITVTPMLGYYMFKPRSGGGEEGHMGRLFRGYRSLLVGALRFRWPVLIATLALFVVAIFGFRQLDQSFFPPATRPQFLVDVFLPAGTDIRASERFAEGVERFIRKQPHVTHVTSFVGSGGLRFLLVYTPERPNPAYVQFLVAVDDHHTIDGLITTVQRHLDQESPNANAVAKKFLLGPGSGGRVQVRFSGPDYQTLRELAAHAEKIFDEDGRAKGVRSDWREQVKIIQPTLLDLQANRNGITRSEVSQALQASFEGRTVGLYREPGSAGTGTFPQETRLLPIVARPPLDERTNVDVIRSLQIWSPAANKMIPMSQVVSDVEIAWEDPVIMRRNRLATVTVHADPRFGLPSHLLNRVRPKIEQIALPQGYSLQWGGEDEDSREARAALARPLPAALLLMVFIVVCLFNSMRSTLVICLAVPLAIIGVTAGLMVTRQPFGFMALLGVIALGGEQIKNSIVLVDEIYTQRELGKQPYTAVVDASVSRLRPVLLVAVTTVLGMIPLLQDPFFVAMAATIMFGLSFACVLTMIVVPVLYSFFFSVPTRALAE